MEDLAALFDRYQPSPKHTANKHNNSEWGTPETVFDTLADHNITIHRFCSPFDVSLNVETYFNRFDADVNSESTLLDPPHRTADPSPSLKRPFPSAAAFHPP